MTSAAIERIDLRTALKWGLLVTVVSRIIFFSMGYAAMWFLADTRGDLSQGFLDIWNRWDAEHLIGIAVNGYFGPESPDHAAAFFPLYPLCVRVLVWIGIPELAGGLIISAVGSVVAFAFLFRLAGEEYGRSVGLQATLYLAVFPTAVFLVAPYTESLFLAGAIPAFYYARRQRWNLTVLPAAVATGTRAAGVFVVAGLFFEFLRHRDLSLDRTLDVVRSLCLALIPAAAYLGFLAQQPGGFGTYFEEQRLGWGRELAQPIRGFTQTIDMAGPNEPTQFVISYRLEIVAALMGLFLVAWAVKKREWGYAGYMGTTMAALLLSSFYFSVPRFLLTFFPAMIFLAVWTKDRPLAHNLVLTAFTAFAAMGLIIFNYGHWFF